MSGAINTILIALFLLCWFYIIKKLIWNRCAPVKTVKAEVVDKYMQKIASKYPGTCGQERYVIVFKAEDKKISFNVSEFSYNNYQINEKGTLKYKGNRIISFK